MSHKQSYITQIYVVNLFKYFFYYYSIIKIFKLVTGTDYYKTVIVGTNYMFPSNFIHFKIAIIL